MPRRGRSTASKDANLLKVKSVDYLKQSTAAEHFTADYDADELVVRRGFPFKLMLTLTRPLEENENIEFELRMGGRPMAYHGSLIRLPKIDPLQGEDVDGYKLLASVDGVVTVQIHTSAKSTGVGKWLLAMRTKTGRRRQPYTVVSNDIIVIFNPWNKHDPVYMADESWRNEYVLNDEGIQYFGNRWSIGGFDWYYGQFDEPVMKAVLRLLDMGTMPYRDHRDPVAIARHMSALVNAQDDNGVLVGNWDGDYDDGTDPGAWNGSVEILRQFLEGKESVKYGQCWVFSGLLTTVMRCLGIPARSLTNFESAHDTDGNLTIDYHYDVKGKPEDNDDSVWNFHVWNDVWMARESLPEGYGGWQAVDATPQETSKGTFRCGPMSVQALKEGQVTHDYDGKFIYAEVNASKKHWMRRKDAKDGEWRALRTESRAIGHNISTKAVGNSTREDITHQYKYAEGTPEEQLSFKVARKFVKLTHQDDDDVGSNNDLTFEPTIPSAVSFGSDVTFTIKVGNNSEEPRDVFISVVAKSMQYNGSLVAQVFDSDYEREVKGGGGVAEVEVTIPTDRYLRSIGTGLKLFLMGGDDGTAFAHQQVVDFNKPDLVIEMADNVKVGEEAKATISFKNPLNVEIEGGAFSVEGAGIRNAVRVTSGKVGAGADCKVEVGFVPRRVGSRRIVASFTSKQMSGLRAVKQLQVEE